MAVNWNPPPLTSARGFINKAETAPEYIIIRLAGNFVAADAVYYKFISCATYELLECQVRLFDVAYCPIKVMNGKVVKHEANHQTFFL
jgi:hypothetical protein